MNHGGRVARRNTLIVFNYSCGSPCHPAVVHSLLNLKSGKGRILDFETIEAIKIYKSDIDVCLQNYLSANNGTRNTITI